MDLPQPSIGVGYKPQFFDDALASAGEVDFLEIHAENYMGDGGRPHAQLAALCERFALSVHGVGLSIGGAGALDGDHLQRLKRLIDRYQPALFSEHLAWSSHDDARNRWFLNDLLPIPYCQPVLDRVVEHIDQLQSLIRREVLIENPSTYVAFAQTDRSEIDFITEMQRRTGCGLLLDVNNVHISAQNQRLDAQEYLAAYPMAAVREIHLAGFATDSDDGGDLLLIDAHDRQVAPPVWELYRQAVARCGAVSTLIEWDNDLPDWSTLLGEARQARRILCELETDGCAAAQAA